jgi:hypothetical protein
LGLALRKKMCVSHALVKSCTLNYKAHTVTVVYTVVNGTVSVKIQDSYKEKNESWITWINIESSKSKCLEGKILIISVKTNDA